MRTAKRILARLVLFGVLYVASFAINFPPGEIQKYGLAKAAEINLMITLFSGGTMTALNWSIETLSKSE